MKNESEQEIYFIGIALPEPLNTEISKLQWRLYDNNNPNMLKPLLPHVTLLHPPALRGTLPSELIPEVQKGAKPYLPLNIELSQIKFFSEQTCTLQAESFGLHSLYEKLIPNLPFAVQAAQLKRNFSPHVTLAQIKQPEKLDREKMCKEINSTLTLPLRFEVTSLTYFKRILPRVYKPQDF